MTELERLRAENAEMRNLLAQTDAAMSTFIGTTSEAVEIMRRVSTDLVDIAPATAAAAADVVTRWTKYISDIEAAKAQAARVNAPTTNVKN